MKGKSIEIKREYKVKNGVIKKAAKCKKNINKYFLIKLIIKIK
jgi:hypothetical protein